MQERKICRGVGGKATRKQKGPQRDGDGSQNMYGQASGRQRAGATEGWRCVFRVFCFAGALRLGCCLWRVDVAPFCSVSDGCRETSDYLVPLHFTVGTRETHAKTRRTRREGMNVTHGGSRTAGRGVAPPVREQCRHFLLSLPTSPRWPRPAPSRLHSSAGLVGAPTETRDRTGHFKYARPSPSPPPKRTPSGRGRGEG